MGKGLTSGEASALIAMIIPEVLTEEIVGWVLAVVREEDPGCSCGRPEEHRQTYVTSSERDALLVQGILVEGLRQVIGLEADRKYGAP